MDKTCTVCNIAKSIEEFEPCGKHRRGTCRSCRREKQKIKSREYYAANKEEVLIRQRDYYKANKEKIDERHNEWYQRNKETVHERYARNKDYIRERNKNRYERNKDMIRERARKRYRENIETHRAKDRERYKIRREYIKEYVKARRRGLRSNTPVVKHIIWCRKQPCIYCGKSPSGTHDHVIPISKGGTHSVENIKPCCQPCNDSKGSKHLEEWISIRIPNQKRYPELTES